MSDKTVAEIGELALIERLKPFCAADAVGDDAALMAVRPGFELVVTTDVLVDEVHFSDRTTPPYAVGWRSAAANLSDLAAMGASLIGITVGLALPPQTPWPWVEQLYQGMSDCVRRYGGEIYGGDLCRAASRVVSITALGEVAPQRAIRRDRATEQMAVVVTGAHGGSRAGLAVLLQETVLQEIDSASDEVKDWVRAHQMPVPRFDAIAQLTALTDEVTLGDRTGEAMPIAGMDSSDGLANALLQLSHSSGVGIEIFRAAIPLPNGLARAVGADVALNWALYGGEDFELVLCLPQALAKVWVERGGAIAIGCTTAEHAGEVRLFEGPLPENLLPENLLPETALSEVAESAPSTPTAYQRIQHKSFQHF